MAENFFNLETFLRAYMDLVKNNNWSNVYPSGFRRFWESAVNVFLYGDQAKKEDFAKRYPEDQLPESVLEILKMMEAARDRSSAQQDVVNTVKFVAEQVFDPKTSGSSSYYDNVTYLQMFLNRVKKMQDQDLVYNAITFLKSNLRYMRPSAYRYETDGRKYIPLFKDMVFMLANNPNATLTDLSELIYWVETPEEAEKIVNDVIAKTDEMLDKEMSRDIPDASSVKNLTWYPSEVINVARGSESSNPVYAKELQYLANKDRKKSDEFYNRLNQLAKLVMDKYNFDKIIGSGDQHYVTTYEDTLEKKNIDLVNENTKIKEENKNLSLENDGLHQRVDSDKAEIERLKNEIERLNQELSKERNAKVKAQNTVSEFTKATEKLEKAGMFERKKIIEQMSQITASEL